MKRKIVFFDIDGTIYDYRTGVEPSTRQAIRLLGQQGHIPVLCTGRARAMIREELIELGFQGIVGSCGAYVEFLNVPIKNYLVEEKAVERILESCMKYRLDVILEGPDALYFNEQLMTEEYQERILKMTGKYTKLLPFHQGSKVEMNKMTIHFREEAELDGFRKDTEGILEAILHFEDGEEYYAECVPVGYNKATGIAELLNYLNIPREDSYAFGDSVNDLEMLQYVKYGIAMGNSSPEVFAVTKYRTAEIHDDGIYKGLAAFALI